MLARCKLDFMFRRLLLVPQVMSYVHKDELLAIARALGEEADVAATAPEIVASILRYLSFKDTEPSSSSMCRSLCARVWTPRHQGQHVPQLVCACVDTKESGMVGCTRPWTQDVRKGAAGNAGRGGVSPEHWHFDGLDSPTCLASAMAFGILRVIHHEIPNCLGVLIRQFQDVYCGLEG